MDEQVNADGKPLNEEQPVIIENQPIEPTTEQQGDINEIAPNVKPVEAIPADPALVEAGNKPIEVTEEPVETIPLSVSNTEQTASPDKYTVHAADLNAYPELSQQGVQLYDQVAYGSLYVNKYATAAQESVVPEPWPRPIGDEKAKGIAFNG